MLCQHVRKSPVSLEREGMEEVLGPLREKGPSPVNLKVLKALLSYYPRA